MKFYNIKNANDQMRISSLFNVENESEKEEKKYFSYNYEYIALLFITTLLRRYLSLLTTFQQNSNRTV